MKKKIKKRKKKQIIRIKNLEKFVCRFESTNLIKKNKKTKTKNKYSFFSKTVKNKKK